MAIWVGIDEAGYGPKLGPLCLGLFALKGIPWQDHFWDHQECDVTHQVKLWRHQLVVCDSKELHKSKTGLEKLETSALSLGPLSHTLLDWLTASGGFSVDESTRYPWYDLGITLPQSAKLDRVQNHKKSLHASLKRCGVDEAHTLVRPVLEKRFNSLLKSHNKHALEFTLIMELLERVIDEHPGDEYFVDIDKLGGRSHYADKLSAHFPMQKIDIVQESRFMSHYRIGENLHIRFRQSADQSSFTVAAASILAKYTRELFMTSFNRFWSTKIEGLTPTAGYPQDASRWLEVVRPQLFKEGFNESWLVREK